jgi:signal transduction histidine kinase
VRVDSFSQASGPIAEEARALGIRSSIGCPIVVGGRLWGVIAASSKRESPFPPDTESQMADFTKLVATAIANADDLREVSRGIHPAVLSEGGLGPALRTLARRSAVPVELELGAEERLPALVEVAAYYVISEALTNTAKHARASYARVAVQQRDSVLWLSVGDDGVGGAEPARGSGLIGLRDRVEALGGSIQITSPAGGDHNRREAAAAASLT